MQLFNSWYAVELSSSLSNDHPLEVQLHGQRFAVWRLADGSSRAVRDRCPHKGASLSAGRVNEGQLSCGYHGWCFSGDGDCTAIPAQHSGDPMPRRAKVQAIPCQEAFGFLWLWWSDSDVQPALPVGDLPAVGPIAEAGDPGWRTLEGRVVWQAHWLRVLEAFMDLTHAPFVHSGSFGGMAPDQLEPLEKWVENDSLYERFLIPRDRHYRAHQGRGMFGLFNREEGEANADEASNSGEQHVQLWMSNVSLVRVVFGDFQISLLTAHIPVDGERTLNLWRHFRSFLRNPLVDANSRARVDKFMAEDQRMVETLTPALIDLDGHGDLLLSSDTMTLALRKLLREKREAGLLR